MVNEIDVFYMKQALAEANAAYKQGEIPIGAVVVCRDKIIAKSHNLTELLHDVTAHAEMQAITSAAEHPMKSAVCNVLPPKPCTLEQRSRAA